jgi:hypothetical protein
MDQSVFYNGTADLDAELTPSTSKPKKDGTINSKFHVESTPIFTADGKKPCTLLETIISMVKKGKDGNKITFLIKSTKPL